MILYLSGPMTGKTNYWCDFYVACLSLQDAGHVVLNPAFLPMELEYEAAMEIDLTMLKHADGIVMLKGWKKSQGARRELKEALRLGIKVFYGTDAVTRSKEAGKCAEFKESTASEMDKRWRAVFPT